MTHSLIRFSVIASCLLGITACGTVEKTSPCKRPAELTGFYQEPMECGSMEMINQSNAAAAINLLIGDR